MYLNAGIDIDGCKIGISPTLVQKNLNAKWLCHGGTEAVTSTAKQFEDWMSVSSDFAAFSRSLTSQRDASVDTA